MANNIPRLMRLPGDYNLPILHKDPFNRILLAQAKFEGIALLTSDGFLKKYPAPVLFISRT